MAHTRFWKPTTVLCMLPMLLVLGRAAASAQAPAAGKAKVDRLVMGLITPYLDYMRPWIQIPPDLVVKFQLTDIAGLILS